MKNAVTTENGQTNISLFLIMAKPASMLRKSDERTYRFTSSNINLCNETSPGNGKPIEKRHGNEMPNKTTFKFD